jgi:hypothetical protein
MKAMIIGDNFTATSEQMMRDLAASYDVYVKALAIVEGDAEQVAMVNRSARRALGRHFNTAKQCWELMQ